MLFWENSLYTKLLDTYTDIGSRGAAAPRRNFFQFYLHLHNYYLLTCRSSFPLYTINTFYTIISYTRVRTYIPGLLQLKKWRNCHGSGRSLGEEQLFLFPCDLQISFALTLIFGPLYLFLSTFVNKCQNLLTQNVNLHDRLSWFTSIYHHFCKRLSSMTKDLVDGS